MFGRFAISFGIAAALLVGCGGAQPPIAGPLQASTITSARPAVRSHLDSSLSYQLLHRFPGYANDGFDPAAALVSVNGTLYGTTKYGGSSTNCAKGCGTVFSLDPSGTEKLLYSFTGGSDGAYPAGALLDVAGTLYGTTEAGGGKGGCACGTVFSISTGGSETVLHRFGGVDDGYDPEAALIDVGGVLYGTTVYGGKGDDGTVYSMTTGGRERVLHTFPCDSDDGCLPIGGLVNVNGTLYGTTVAGGNSGTCSGGCGTVYSISTSGSESVIYSFADGSDGSQPFSGLINVNGTMYGTTSQGGGSACNGFGCGTVYSMTTSGSEQIVHSFTGGGDGELPRAGLIDVKGTLYGTTVSGGRSSCVVHEPWFDYSGCGTVYSLMTGGGEQVVYDFKVDGGEPTAGLVDAGGVLYGTTPYTSKRNCDVHSGRCGTAFAITP
jgi:uncharacterized repeat protein (TIGR03803 family)